MQRNERYEQMKIADERFWAIQGASLEVAGEMLRHAVTPADRTYWQGMKREAIAALMRGHW